MPIDAKTLEDKVKSIYPELGEHGLAVTVKESEDAREWLITVSKGEHTLTTHISSQDAADCIGGNQCVHLGVQIGTFVENYCLGGGACIT